MTPLILDTDIGTDVDDALTLGLLLGSPEVSLAGVTTVYGDTLLRARLARRLARTADPDLDIPFIPGARETLSGRAVWWAGHEGELFEDLDDEAVDGELDAAAFLAETAAASPGEVEVLAIGPLTNIALALRRDPDFARNVRRLVVMGGDFADGERTAEHNFKSDAVAAREVFASGANILVAGLDITTRVALGRNEIDRVGEAGPFGSALRAEVERYWRFHGRPWNNPHDPIAALAGIAPELFTTRTRNVAVLDSGGRPGLVVDDENAPEVSIVSGLDEHRVVEQIVDRILAAARPGGV